MPGASIDSRAVAVQVGSVPTAPSLSHYWGFGSALGLFFASQVASGLLMAAFYQATPAEAFPSVLRVGEEAAYGWLAYLAHSAGAGLVFALLYVHVTKWVVIRSSSLLAILSGWLILLLTVVAAFLGYVLLWQQMSFWAATVITSLISVVPFGGDLLVSVWGSFAIDAATLTRFYAAHFLVTLLVAALAVGHLLLLHALGSTASGEQPSSADVIGFGRYYLLKDVILLALLIYASWHLVLWLPTVFADVELYAPVNTMATPLHIVPEWYLLAYYATLRGIPSKVLGSLLTLSAMVQVALAHQSPQVQPEALAVH